MLSVLKDARAFRGCTPQELQDVAEICQRVALKNGERVFEAKKPADYLYLVAKGAIELKFTVTYYRASKEITIDRILETELFGWSALGESRVYTLSAVAVRDSDLLRMDAKDLQTLCAENHHLGYILMKNIAEITAERFDRVQRMLIDVIQKDLKEKEL